MLATMAGWTWLLVACVLVVPVHPQIQEASRTYPNELLYELLSPNGFNAGLRTVTDRPAVGPPPVCWNSWCARYKLLQQTENYERRRYDRMAVVVAEDASSLLAPMTNYFRLKMYFEEAQNVENVTMPLTFPVITALKASHAHMTMMPIPPKYQASPPTPTVRFLRVEYLPAMDVLVKPYQSVAFGAGNQEAVNEFRKSLGHVVPLASGAAFVADYAPATEFFNRRSEIWLISSYPRRPVPTFLPGK